MKSPDPPIPKGDVWMTACLCCAFFSSYVMLSWDDLTVHNFHGHFKRHVMKGHRI